MDESTAAAHAHPGISDYRALMDNLLEACQVIGFDWRYLYLNKSAVRQNRLTSAEQMLGRTMMAFYPGIDETPVFAELRHCMEMREPTQTETEFLFPDGTLRWFDVRCEPVPEGMFILSLDITERKHAESALHAAEEQLRQSQKMEAIGRLAAGVAHDFNSLLTVILLSSEIAAAKLKPSDPQRQSIQQIRQAGERAAALTRQLLAFSRQQVLEPRVLDINAVVRNTETMLRRLISEDFTLHMKLAADLGHVKADPGQIEQVVMNLVLNARDAMPSGGSITIESGNVDLDNGWSEKHAEILPGRYVMLAVSDTGAGMDKDTQARIFEPFFTTKEQGKGTGLGLSTVFGIARQSGGTVRVYSEPGHGSCFKVYLPLIDDNLSPQPLPAENPLSTGDETILLVEDDEQVRAVTSLALQLAGYTVLEARRGQEAIRICEKHTAPIHLLISDVIMPDMGGRKVAESIQALRPGIRTLFVSGYTDDAMVRYGIEIAQVAFLQKPFTPDSLAQKVREVLDQAR